MAQFFRGSAEACFRLLPVTKHPPEDGWKLRGEQWTSVVPHFSVVGDPPFFSPYDPHVELHTIPTSVG